MSSVFHNPFKTTAYIPLMLTAQELHRKLFHLIMGIVTVALLYYEILSPFAVFLIIIAGVLLSFLTKRVRLPIISSFVDHFERDNQKSSFPGRGAIFFFVGALLALKLFDKNIALASIMVLTLGDSISHMVGAQYGKIRNIFNGDNKKLLEGTLAGTIVGFLGALIFVPLPEAFLGSLCAMIAEVVKIDFNEKAVDDNVTVPLVAGTVMLLVEKMV